MRSPQRRHITFLPVHLAAVLTCLRASWVLTKSSPHFVQIHLRLEELYSKPSRSDLVGFMSSTLGKGMGAKSPVGERLELYGVDTSRAPKSDKSSAELHLGLVARTDW